MRLETMIKEPIALVGLAGLGLCFLCGVIFLVRVTRGQVVSLAWWIGLCVVFVGCVAFNFLVRVDFVTKMSSSDVDSE